MRPSDRNQKAATFFLFLHPHSTRLSSIDQQLAGRLRGGNGEKCFRRVAVRLTLRRYFYEESRRATERTHLVWNGHLRRLRAPHDGGPSAELVCTATTRTDRPKLFSATSPRCATLRAPTRLPSPPFRVPTLPHPKNVFLSLASYSRMTRLQSAPPVLRPTVSAAGLKDQVDDLSKI